MNKENSKISECADQVYVPDDEVDYNEEMGSKKRVIPKVFFSTRRLLSITQNGSEHVNNDSIYKMTYLGYPLILYGSNDFAKVFHMLAMTWKVRLLWELWNIYEK